MKHLPSATAKGPAQEKGQPDRWGAGPNGRFPAFLEHPVVMISAILLLTFLAFLPSLKNGFLYTWDDNVYITDNPIIRQLNAGTIKAMFTTPVNGTYVPLAILSFSIEYHFFGLNPLPFHIINLVIHLLCSLLVFRLLLLLRLKKLFAVLGALLFSLHPMHVESVAWITERKDLLFAFFYLSSLIAYVFYIRDTGRKKGMFILSIVLFTASLFSKIQAVALPLSLFLADYYFDRKFNLRNLLEKVPFLLLSLLFGIGGYVVLKEQGVLQTNELYSLSHRIFFGTYALFTYLLQFAAPFRLSALYPYPVSPGDPLPVYFFLIMLSLVIAGWLVYRSRKSTKVLVFGSLFFLFNILFVLQVVIAGSAFRADRFSYVPYIGFSFIAAWSIQELAERKSGIRFLVYSFVALILAGLITLTFPRNGTWRSDEALWTDVIEKYPDRIAQAYGNRGVIYGNRGYWDLAISDFSRAVRIEPDFPDAYFNLGTAYKNTGQPGNAIACFSMAIQLDPGNASALNSRGTLYGSLGEWNKAISDYSRAIEAAPGYAKAWYNRGVAFGQLGNWKKAVSDFDNAIMLNPGYSAAWTQREQAYKQLEN
jgi:protein O-mannosyl-transferase